MSRKGRVSAAVACVLIAACGGVRVAPAADVRVVASEPSAEVDALVESFFGASADTPTAELDARLDAALLKYPSSGALHEVRAYWAVLTSDDHAAWEHFLLAAADLRNPDAANDLSELGRLNETRSEALATAGALLRIADANPDVEVRTRALYLRAGVLRDLGRFQQARESSDRLGFVREVALLGAFDNEDGKGLAEAYPPESKIDFAATAPGSVVPVRWRTIEAQGALGVLPLHDLVFPNQGAVAYAAFWVQVPVATQATLRMSTESPLAAWVNHAAVAREDHVQHWALDNVTAPASLKAGWNEVLVKSAGKTGSWSLGLRVTDVAGNVIPSLVASAMPHSVEGAASSVAPKATPSPAHTHREAFVNARSFVLRGLYQPGLAAFERLLSHDRSSALLRYFTADAAERDRQTERAMDLLSSGITEHDALPGFLQARAKVYVQKDLLNQAQADLARVVRASPSARVARMDLADVLGKRAWPADRVAVLSDVTRRWPDSSWAFGSLGSALEAEGHIDTAETAYRAAIALDAFNVAPMRSLRKLLEARQEKKEVEQVFDRLHELSPTDVSDQLARAEFERTHGGAAEADARLRSLSLQSPDHPSPYLRRGLLREELSDEPQAIALFQSAQERDPRDSWVAQRLEHLRPAADDALTPYVATDDDIELAIRRPTVKADTASHVQTLLSDSATLLNSDGSVRMITTEVLRALTQRGRDELVRLGLPGSGTVRVLRAYAETPDGKRQEASSIEKTSVRFRNLEVGSTVVLKYAHYPTKTGALGDDYFRDTAFSSLARHIDRMRWVVVASKQKPIHVAADARVRHTVRESGAWVVHEFVREGASAIPAEPNMVPLADLEAHVVVTTIPSWDSFIRWEKAILDESFPADPAIDALAASLTHGATTPRDKLGKLFAYVAQEIRYQQEYESVLAGFKPHRSSVVLERKYGDCKDKATLLIALGRAVGLKIHFVVLATHAMGHPERSVVLPWFNHAIAYVPAQTGIDEPFFLDATVDALDLWNLREDDQGAAALVVDPTNGTWSWKDIPYQAPAFEKQEWKVEIDVASPEKITARSHFEIRGDRASSLRTMLRSEDQSRQIYDLLGSALFPGARVSSASAPDHESLVHPLTIDEELDLAGSVRQEGEHYRLKFPNEADVGQAKLTERQTPVDLGTPRSSEATIVVHLGSSLRLADTPSAVDVVEPCFHARRTVTTDHATVTLKDTYEQTCTRVSVEDYPRFHTAMDHARSLLDAALVFERVDAKRHK